MREIAKLQCSNVICLLRQQSKKSVKIQNGIDVPEEIHFVQLLLFYCQNDGILQQADSRHEAIIPTSAFSYLLAAI